MARIVWVFFPWAIAVIAAAVYAAMICGEPPRGWLKATAYAVYAVLMCCVWTAFALHSTGIF